MLERVLVVDDHDLVRLTVTRALRDWGFLPLEAATVAAARGVWERERPRVVLLDVGLPDGSGLALLAEIKRRDPRATVIIITGNANTDDAFIAGGGGAAGFITKPIDRDRLHNLLRQGLSSADESRQPTVISLPPLVRPPSPKLIGESPAARSMAAFIRQAAATEATVLLEGESGTGKELMAKAIHATSPRAAGPLVTVNCGALNANLIESELFGHEKGAFTGAVARQVGRFERAQGGTLFLDEVGELPLPDQVKLLRALQERRIERLGGTKEIEVDVRIIAATNRDLWAEVARGNFRKDFYYRLAVMVFLLPPLRERDEDVLLLARHFLAQQSARRAVPIEGFTPEAEAALMQHDWPGNVRELSHVIERAAAFESTCEITRPSLVFQVRRDTSATANGDCDLSSGTGALLASSTRFDDLALDTRRELIRQALEKSYGDRERAAKLLGLASRHQLYRRMQKLGLSDETGIRKTP